LSRSLPNLHSGRRSIGKKLFCVVAGVVIAVAVVTNHGNQPVVLVDKHKFVIRLGHFRVSNTRPETRINKFLGIFQGCLPGSLGEIPLYFQRPENIFYGRKEKTQEKPMTILVTPPELAAAAAWAFLAYTTLWGWR
jgi:hypothetical protein